MLRYPQTVSSQQVILAPLQSIINNVPACEQWIAFMAQANTSFSSLSPGALQTLSQIAQSMRKTFDYLHTNNLQSIYSSQYLLTLAQGAETMRVNAYTASLYTTGTVTIQVTQNAQTALNTFVAWDAVLGYSAPSNVAQIANILMGGVSIS